MSIRSWLHAPSQSNDPSSQRLRTLYTLVLAGCAVLVAALAASVALRPAEWRGHMTYAAMLAQHVVVLAIARRRYLRTAIVVHAVSYTLVVLGTMVQYGGVRTPAGFVLPPMVLLIGLTWNGRAALVTAVAMALALLVLVVLENTGALRVEDPPALTPMRLWIVATGTLVITAVILQVALGILRRSREELAAQEQARRGLEERLAQARQLEAVGTLAAGVAHDFGNVLQVIYAYSDLCASHSDPAVAKAGRIALEAAEHGAALTRQLLTFGQRGVADPRVIDLNELLRKLDQLARGFVGEHVELSFELSKTPALIRADRTQLEQVVMNLLANARDALPNGGHVRVRTQAGASTVTLVVEDDGVGMSPEIVERLFEPFFTTKGQDRGTGLGLATVHGIVERYGGRIEVASGPGAGSRFTIALPLVAGEETPSLSRPARAQPTDRARILMVDDDERVRTAVAAMLLQRGHRVTIAASAAEALDAFAAAKEPPTLLLTDVVMPDMPGPELAHRLRERVPDLRVLFMSSYAHDHVAVRGVLAEGVYFIEKPFDLDALLERVDAVLAATEPGVLPARAGGSSSKRG